MSHNACPEAAWAFIDRYADPDYLPSYDEVVAAFDGNGKVWNDFRYNNEIYELVTTDLGDFLGEHLAESARQLGAPERAVSVVEVGAGSGRLAKAISRSAAFSQQPGLTLTATDSGLWSIPTVHPVEVIDYQTALDQLQPDIVLSSWMLNGEDWTADFRRAPSVQEYVLIGEGLYGSVGANQTWLPQYHEADGFFGQPLYFGRSINIMRNFGQCPARCSGQSYIDSFKRAASGAS